MQDKMNTKMLHSATLFIAMTIAAATLFSVLEPALYLLIIDFLVMY